MVLGAPFTVDGVTYTPADTLNYDHVGYASVGADGGPAVSLAHRALPLPSYVEVTSLLTGKTILARVERRGPMSGPNLVELSPGAALQLSAAGNHVPVRVRRVNPPEADRALLRTGQHAPDRMDMPMPLVGVLMRKLDPAAMAPPAAPSTAPAKTPVALPGKPPLKPAVAKQPHPAPKPELKPARPPEPKPAAAPRPAAAGKVVVQVGTFSSTARAAAVARKVGGQVSQSGKFYRVRIGGFAAPADAQGALAKARGAGYSDARIQRAD